MRGLVNLGNTCFFNSVLQNMASLDALAAPLCAIPQKGEGVLTTCMRNFMREMRMGKASLPLVKSLPPYAPRALFSEIVRQAPQFKGFRQQVGGMHCFCQPLPPDT